MKPSCSRKGTLELRVNKKREENPLSQSRQQQMPWTINSSRADFFRCIPTLSLVRSNSYSIFLSKIFKVWLHGEEFEAGSKFRCNKPVPVTSSRSNFHFLVVPIVVRKCMGERGSSSAGCR